ncbi:hypothetical protein HZH68_001206 [Vespula germanica]|uniref:Uncharacterized protein n=1 Tax=Vespula germanica TaxID=30212 RepID=A0A834NUZ8_VESGE|nr:hypothetical protein HZH68_001206 [Vespula germanica]
MNLVFSYMTQSVQNQCPQSRESTPHEERVLSDQRYSSKRVNCEIKDLCGYNVSASDVLSASYDSSESKSIQMKRSIECPFSQSWHVPIERYVLDAFVGMAFNGSMKPKSTIRVLT